MKNNAVTDQEKREKKIVVKKLAEMEEELKVFLKEVETKYPLKMFYHYKVYSKNLINSKIFSFLHFRKTWQTRYYFVKNNFCLKLFVLL